MSISSGRLNGWLIFLMMVVIGNHWRRSSFLSANSSRVLTWIRFPMWKSICFVHQTRLFCAFLCPLRVEIAISNEKCQKVYQKTTRILQNTPFPVTVFQISKRALLESVNLVNGNITIYCKIGILIRQRLTGKATATPSTERYIQKTPIRDDDRDLVLLKNSKSYLKKCR